jgi:hypothetical protein
LDRICLALTLPALWHHFQRQFFPMLAEELGPVSELDKRFGQTVSVQNLGPLMLRFSRDFRFKDAAGLEHTGKSKLGRKRPAHRVGDVVPVIHPPGAPDEGRVDQFAYLWLLPSISGGVAALCLSILALGIGRRLFSRAGSDGEL